MVSLNTDRSCFSESLGCGGKTMKQAYLCETPIALVVVSDLRPRLKRTPHNYPFFAKEKRMAVIMMGALLQGKWEKTDNKFAKTAGKTSLGAQQTQMHYQYYV